MENRTKQTRVHSRNCEPARGKFVPTQRLECVYSCRNFRRGINRRNTKYRNLSHFARSGVLGIRRLLSLVGTVIASFV